MIAHQPFHRFTFIRCQAQSRGNSPRNLGADNGMIFGTPLANIVQQKGRIDHLAIDAFGQDTRGDRQFFDQFAAFDLGQNRYGLDDMLVHRVMMIDIELHHRDDVFKLGDKTAQNTQFIHMPQSAFGVAMVQQKIMKNAHRLGIFAHIFVDQMQIGRDQAHHIGMQQIPRPQPFLKDFQNVQRVRQKARRRVTIDPPLHQLIARSHLFSVEKAEQPRFGFGVAGL